LKKIKVNRIDLRR